MYGIVYDPRIALYPPRVSLALRIEVSTPCGARLNRGTTIFFPGLLDVYVYGRIHNPGMGPYPHRVTLAPRTPG